MGYGDITSRVALRQQLQCKNFSWYLKHIYPEHPLPTEGAFVGTVKLKKFK